MSKQRKPTADLPADIGVILRQWDIYSLAHVKQKAGGFVVRDEKGKRFLVQSSLSTVDLLNDVLNRLYEKNWLYAYRFIPTKYGDAWVEWQDKAYYLTDYFKLDKFEVKKSEQALLLAEVLADMHNCAEGMQLKMQWRNCAKWEQLPQLAAKGRNMTDYFRGPNHYWAKKCIAAYEQMPNDALKELQYEARAVGSICHGKYGPHNVLALYDRPLIIDWQDVCLGLPVLDLGCYLLNVMPSFEWKKEIYQGIVGSYHQHRFLSAADQEVLMYFLSLPHEFLKYGYQAEKNQIGAKEWQKRLVKITESEKRKDKFLAKLKR